MAQLEATQTRDTAGTGREERFEKKQHVNTYSIVIICFITLSSAAYGYAGSIIATTLTQPSFVEHMKLATASNEESLIGAMNALFYVGGIIGSFIAGWTMNKWGRKFTAGLGDVLLLISGACLTASVNPAMFIVFRFVSGLGSFVILSSVPIWVAELAPPVLRGILTDVHAVFMMVGYTLACYVGLGFYFVSGSNQWRGAMSFQMVLPAIILCGLYWMPESPRYLISKDRIEEARTIVHKMHSDRHDPTDEFVKREFYQIRKQIELDKRFRTSYLAIFKQASTRKRALMTIFLEFALMSSGVLVILNYGSIIWAALGFNKVQTLNFQGGFQVTGLVFNIVAMAFVDKVKRPHLMAGGFLSITIVMSVETALQRYYLGTTDRSGLIACAFGIILFQAVYSVFLDGPTFFYVAEIWPSHLRSQGSAIAMATMSLTNLMWLQSAPHAFNTIGWKFYLFFICIPLTAAVVIWFFYPDTLHKPLEEIAAIFGDKDMVAIYQRELDLGNVPVNALDDAQVLEKTTTSGSVECVETAA